MPATVRKINGKFRVVERGPSGRFVIVKNKAGAAVDGGGHTSESRAKSQARAINAPPGKRRK